MSNIVITPGRVDPVVIGLVHKPMVDVDVGVTGPIDIEVGTTGKAGPRGPEGGTPIIALPYDDWPPVDPEPDTLYLRLAP